MKIPRILAAMLVCVLASVAGATTYYVDATGGDDANAGTSSAGAWKTLGKVNSSTFAPGDQILLKRGEVWQERLIPPSSGTSGNVITFDSYGSGEAPTITGYLGFPFAAWTQDSATIWKTSITSTSFNYILFGGSIWGLKHTNGKSACIAPYDFYFAANVLYVYSVGNPASYYGSVAAMMNTTLALVDIIGRSWLQLQHLKLTYYDAYGVKISAASDHITVANIYADGIIPAGTMPHGFYVSASSAPADINFYNVDAHRNYEGFRFDGAATGIVITNCRAYANRDKGIQDNTGGSTYSYCHFYGNGLGVLVSTDYSGGVAGAGNVAAYVSPNVKGFQRYPARVSLSVDDTGLVQDADLYIDSILPEFNVRGQQLSIAVVAGYALSNTLLPKIQAWINAGQDVNSHSWSHQYFTSLNGVRIKYAGQGTAAAVSIAGNVLTTTVTGGPGGENLSFDLTNQSYDTMSKLAATISGRPNYSATMDPSCQGAVHSIALADASGQDIKTPANGYLALLQKDRLMPDEFAASKAWMTANLTGLPSVRAYVYPGGVEDSQTQGWAASAGYAGARGAFSMDLGTKDVYGRGVNIQNITSFGANPSLQHLTAQQMDDMIATLLFKSSVWGAPYGLFWHKDELAAGEVGNLLDSLIAHGATLMTNTQLVTWLTGQSLVAGTTTYVAAATGADPDFRPTLTSPGVNTGAALGTGYKFDIEGMDQTLLGSGWEMGAYAFVPVGPFVIVVGD